MTRRALLLCRDSGVRFRAVAVGLGDRCIPPPAVTDLRGERGRAHRACSLRGAPSCNATLFVSIKAPFQRAAPAGSWQGRWNGVGRGGLRGAAWAG